MPIADLTAVRGRVRALYDTPPRAYHNWDHVLACVAELDRVRSLCVDAVAVEVAIWFHDCVYDPRRADNEERSSETAGLWLREARLQRARVLSIQEMILATKHAAVPDSADGRLMVDIDLAILGQPAPVFDAYERAIRQEYAFVAETAFRAGRASILATFLARPSIYATSAFRQRYEDAARANLTRSVLALGGAAQ